MRYLDWDVLLFPSSDDPKATHIPFKEFKTQCQAEHKGGAGEATPLMTCFVPSIAAGMKFQISVHSWSPTEPILAPGEDGHQPRELWEVKVVMDGKVNTVAHLAVDAQWPQIISNATHEEGRELEEHKPLAFPPFHNEITAERSWLASDELGRIRVELSAGFWDEKQGYCNMTGVVTFAFQHAPLNYLEQAGIAWPSKEMFFHALPRQSPPKSKSAHANQSDGAHPAPHMGHRKMPSVGNLQLPMIGYAQPLANSGNPYYSYGNSFDPNSRSTSAYSTMSASAGPIIPSNYGMIMPQQPNANHGNIGGDSQYSFRLPSDQIAQIISALNPHKQDQQTQQAAESMPPPPVPMHVLNFRSDSAPVGHYAAAIPQTQRSEVDQHAINAFDRRAASNSNYSDISMHASCNSFPHCITEDPNGCLVHDGGVGGPAPVVKGKKEGSTGTKPARDFFSVTLDAPATKTSQSLPPSGQPMPMTMAPKDMTMHRSLSPVKQTPLPSVLVSSSPADANGKKRTRSALKALNINDGGSPQKTDANKPARKASRASVSSIKSVATGDGKENVADQFLVEHAEGLESQEGMVLDA